jgi:hypothetical protein
MNRKDNAVQIMYSCLHAPPFPISSYPSSWGCKIINSLLSRSQIILTSMKNFLCHQRESYHPVINASEHHFCKVTYGRFNDLMLMIISKC